MAQRYAADGRPLPVITPVTEPFFAAARQGLLRLPHCPHDGFFFYPRVLCPTCLGDDWRWETAQPAGRVHTYTVDRTGQDPHMRPFAPIVPVIVDLDAGPRIVGRMLGVSAHKVAVGAAVRVVFEIVEEMPLIGFEIAEQG